MIFYLRKNYNLVIRVSAFLHLVGETEPNLMQHLYPDKKEDRRGTRKKRGTREKKMGRKRDNYLSLLATLS